MFLDFPEHLVFEGVGFVCCEFEDRFFRYFVSARTFEVSSGVIVVSGGSSGFKALIISWRSSGLKLRTWCREKAAPYFFSFFR